LLYQPLCSCRGYRSGLEAFQEGLEKNAAAAATSFARLAPTAVTFPSLGIEYGGSAADNEPAHKPAARRAANIAVLLCIASEMPLALERSA